MFYNKTIDFRPGILWECLLVSYERSYCITIRRPFSGVLTEGPFLAFYKKTFLWFFKRDLIFYEKKTRRSAFHRGPLGLLLNFFFNKFLIEDRIRYLNRRPEALVWSSMTRLSGPLWYDFQVFYDTTFWSSMIPSFGLLWYDLLSNRKPSGLLTEDFLVFYQKTYWYFIWRRSGLLW